MSTRTITQAAPSSGQSDRIGIGWTVAKMGLVAAMAVLFNFYPEKVGILWSVTDWSTFTPVLAPQFQAYLVWLNPWWGLAVSLEVAHLLLRHWTTATRWMDLASRAFGALVLGALVLGDPFMAAPVGLLALKGILALVVVGMLITAITHFSQLLGGRRLVVELRDR